MLIAGEAAFQAGQAQAVLAIRGLMERLGTPTQPRTALLARLLVQIGRPLGEHDQAAIRGLIDEVAALDDPDLLVRMGGVAGRRGDHATARRLWTQAAARARQLGAAGVLPWALLNLASDDLARGAFRFAEMHADEGRRLARETGQESLACHHDALLAELAAARGREPEVRALAAEILPETAARGLVHVSATVEGARAAAALVAGRPEEALDALTNLWTDALGTGRAEHALRFVPDLTEAAVRARHPERAGEPVAAYETWAEAVSSAPGRALAARNRALLAPAAEADGWYATALDRHRGVDRPLEQARTELLYGEYLRREKRRADARPHLRSALATFERLGADGWAERAAEELRATGETARRRDPSTLDTLTPRELQIARAVADGATNRDVAGQLFLSPRTVDYHLRKVFQKLGVNSRAELIRLMLAG
jgi:DNA-binding CsgD family transcriptional regulator